MKCLKIFLRKNSQNKNDIKAKFYHFIKQNKNASEKRRERKWDYNIYTLAINTVYTLHDFSLLMFLINGPNYIRHVWWSKCKVLNQGCTFCLLANYLMLYRHTQIIYALFVNENSTSHASGICSNTKSNNNTENQIKT